MIHEASRSEGWLSVRVLHLPLPNSLKQVHPFLLRRVAGSDGDFATFRVHEVTSFLLLRSIEESVGSVKVAATALGVLPQRMFLTRITHSPWVDAVPAVPWSLGAMATGGCRHCQGIHGGILVPACRNCSQRAGPRNPARQASATSTGLSRWRKPTATVTGSGRHAMCRSGRKA